MYIFPEQYAASTKLKMIEHFDRPSSLLSTSIQCSNVDWHIVAILGLLSTLHDVRVSCSIIYVDYWIVLGDSPWLTWSPSARGSDRCVSWQVTSNGQSSIVVRPDCGTCSCSWMCGMDIIQKRRYSGVRSTLVCFSFMKMKFAHKCELPHLALSLSSQLITISLLHHLWGLSDLWKACSL